VDSEGTSHARASSHAKHGTLAFGVVPESRQKSVVDFIKTEEWRVVVFSTSWKRLYNATKPIISDALHHADRSWYNMIRLTLRWR
jgi:hypothetical protein